MLQSLSVENYALIERTEVRWKDGFSVITGETGSGKSILLGALGLIQGCRADVKALRDPSIKCVVEAEFNVSNYNLNLFFEENELDYDEVCLIRREISPNGKSRAFVNDTPVSLSVLKELTNHLIDIHSQHETLLLNEDSFQLHLLDAMSGTQSLLTQYQDSYQQYCQDKRKLHELKKKLEEQISNRDYIEFQLNQLSEAAFQEGEQEDLEQEIEFLSHASELRDSMTKSQWLLTEKEESICSSLKEVSNALSSVSAICDFLSPLTERIESSLIDLKDVAHEIESKLMDVNVEPQRLSFVQERLDLLYSLQKKHKVNSLAELLSVKADFETQLATIDSSDEQIDSLVKKIKKEEKLLEELSSKLTKQRENHKQPMEQEVESILHELGMQNAKLEVRLTPLENFSSCGKDCVEFYFSANKNATMQPISSVASGGELSRVMLALKSILSKTDKLPTIILDEIDTGVSGEVADRMGVMMKSMGQYMQVISITHLPQIASKGATHYKVYKEDNESATISHIKCLTIEERVTEIAQMLSGASLSSAAIENAKELLSAN